MSQQSGISSSAPGTSKPMDVKEFNFRLPQNQKKKYSVMQFKRTDNVDLTKWKQAKMERENNKILYKNDVDDVPKFGAGSIFGRERKEEARQKKYGIIAQKYKEEDQPWILKQGGVDSKTAKKFKGRKEGRVNENSSYYILAQLADGTFEAYPVDSWYTFASMQTHRTLNAEEAEEEFGRRDKTVNYFSLMVQKKLRDTKDEDDKEAATSKLKDSDLRLMEDDLYLMSDEEQDDSDDDDRREKGRPKSKKGKGQGKKSEKKRPKKKELDSEAEEESDEGDFDGREFDYISEESSDDDEHELAKTDIKGLDQELQQMEDEEEEEDDKAEAEDGAESKEGEKVGEAKEGKEKNEGDSSSESSGSDSDIDEKNLQSALLLQKKNMKKSSDKTPPKSGSGSRSQTPTVPEATTAATDSTLSSAAQKLESSSLKKRPNSPVTPASKRMRTESPVAGGSANRAPSGHVPLTEDEVKRYLMRRPMTTRDLLVKLNPKRTGLPKETIETRLTEILVKLAPEKRKKDSKIYWFIREHSK